MATRRKSSTRTRSRARPTRQQTIPLPGGMKARVNRGSVSITGTRGPVTTTVNSSGRKTVTLRLPGGFSLRRSL